MKRRERKVGVRAEDGLYANVVPGDRDNERERKRVRQKGGRKEERERVCKGLAYVIPEVCQLDLGYLDS